MEILTAFVGKVAEFAIQPLGRQVGYIIFYKSNRESLHTKVVELNDAREQVQHMVNEAERRGEGIESEVQRWLGNVDKISKDVDEFSKNENQAKMKCLQGFCSNPLIRHKLGRKSTKLVKLIDDLYAKREFPSISYQSPKQDVCNITTKYYEAFDSRVSVVQKIIDELKDSETNIVGLYGIGGVGKTTVVKEINNRAKQENLFNDVVMVLDVKENPDLGRIQKEMAETLGLVLENETQQGKARQICNRINDKKVLVILDDVWRAVDLEAVGIPIVSTCKILLTSRGREVFSSYQRYNLKDFQLHVLSDEETWKLFEKTAGTVVEDPTVRTVAIQIAKKCGGLPLLVVTVASFVKHSNSYSWETLLESLENKELPEKVNLTLEWSYHQLNEQALKQLFLLCGITAWRNYISREDLLNYSMGLGWFKNKSAKKARNALYSLVDRLKEFCLLQDTEENDLVRIHDIVRDVAISIAFRDQHILSRAYGNELEQWPDKDFLKKCTMISFPHCSIPSLPKSLECPEVKFFHLWSKEDSLEISFKFFEGMKELQVLDLTNLRVPSLHLSSHQLLTNLQTLCLEKCELEDIALVGELKGLEVLSFAGSSVKHLPEEIGQLSHLKVLDLAHCSELEVIFPDVISSLGSLEVLRMEKSFNQWEAEGVIGERSNANLSELKSLSQLTTLDIHIRDADHLPAGLFSNKLDQYRILIGEEWKWEYNVNSSCRLLKLKCTSSNYLDQDLEKLLKRSENLYLDALDVVNDIFYQSERQDFQQLKHLLLQNSAEIHFTINVKVALPNLTSLVIKGCNGLRFLLTSSMAVSLEQLKHLEVYNCEIMEEIVSTKENGGENTDNMFCKLEHLELNDLPNLAKFCSGSHIEFASLERLDIMRCSKMEAFICDPSTQNIQYSLFDKKAGFPRLEVLRLEHLNKLTAIWHSDQIAQNSFQRLRNVMVLDCNALINMFVPSLTGRLKALNTLIITACGSLQAVFELRGTNVNETHADTELKTLYCQNLDAISIQYCGSLKNIFPASMARGDLQMLRELKVENCGLLEGIVAKKEELETTMPKFVFPKVTSVVFNDLPQLRSFYLGNHVSEWPLLKSMIIRKCYQVQAFASESSTFSKTCDLGGPFTQSKPPCFLIETGSFPNLEVLVLDNMDIWYGPPSPAEFFTKLKSLSFECYTGVWDDHNIKQLGNADGSLPQVTTLKLYKTWQLRHLWRENSQPSAGPVFSHLRILDLSFCHGLEILRLSSAIRFQTLTILKVESCYEMKHLITYSIAERLVHLTKLEVSFCPRMTKIMANDRDGDGDDDDAGNYEIVFSRLQSLVLSFLDSLQCFCSENCIVKCPSLKNILCRGPFNLVVSSDGVLALVKYDDDDDKTKASSPLLNLINQSLTTKIHSGVFQKQRRS